MKDENDEVSNENKAAEKAATPLSFVLGFGSALVILLCCGYGRFEDFGGILGFLVRLAIVGFICSVLWVWVLDYLFAHIKYVLMFLGFIVLLLLSILLIKLILV